MSLQILSAPSKVLRKAWQISMACWDKIKHCTIECPDLCAQSSEKEKGSDWENCKTDRNYGESNAWPHGEQLALDSA